MTVRELIEKLIELPPHIRVLKPGYEGGYEDIEVGEVSTYAEDVNTSWYFGPHEEVVKYSQHEGKKRFDGVAL